MKSDLGSPCFGILPFKSFVFGKHDETNVWNLAFGSSCQPWISKTCVTTKCSWHPGMQREVTLSGTKYYAYPWSCCVTSRTASGGSIWFSAAHQMWVQPQCCSNTILPAPSSCTVLLTRAFRCFVWGWSTARCSSPFAVRQRNSLPGGSQSKPWRGRPLLSCLSWQFQISQRRMYKAGEVRTSVLLYSSLLTNLLANISTFCSCVIKIWGPQTGLVRGSISGKEDQN